MPNYNFNANGTITNTNNVSVPGAGASYLVYNFSGAALTLDLELSANLTATITRKTGKQEVHSVTGTNSVLLGPDETFHMAIANSTAAALGWRIDSGTTASHGTVRLPGTGHTSAYDNVNPAVFVATI